MGLRTRIKGLIKAQVREKLGQFTVRTSPPDRPEGDVGPPPPREREVIRPPIITRSTAAEPSDGAVGILAQASRDGRQCSLHVSESLTGGLSWWYERPESVESLPTMVQRLLALPGIVSVLLDDATVTLVRGGEVVDWKAVSQVAGAEIRAQLERSESLIPDSVAQSVPTQEVIASALEEVLRDEVNPGVAAHSGHISLEEVRGNAAVIRMGGGCQGCSAADLTLRRGVHQAFRKAVPALGAIYDATDHAAGRNPYFT